MSSDRMVRVGEGGGEAHRKEPVRFRLQTPFLVRRIVYSRQYSSSTLPCRGVTTDNRWSGNERR